MEFHCVSRSGPTSIKIIPKIAFSLDLELEHDENKKNLINKFLNMILKELMRKKKFNQIGKLPKFFLTKEKKKIDDFNIEMWPGYEVQAKIYRGGVYLNSDTATKFVNRETFLHRLENMMYEEKKSKQELEAMYDSSNLENKRVTVITSYGAQKSY